jgi:hypothetical protein
MFPSDELAESSPELAQVVLEVTGLFPLRFALRNLAALTEPKPPKTAKITIIKR